MGAAKLNTATPADEPFARKAEAGWRLEHTYAELPARMFSPVQPTAVAAPAIKVFNHPLAEELGLNPAELARPENAGWFTGNSLPPGASPIAQAYAGHQFGNFTMLGDGRAILLGEQVTPGQERYDIQLKGPGRTPYSRGGDGRAALGPMLREYIISEAMHALGIPTTRSLAVAATGEQVYRETALPGAVLTRVAASHIRVGTFEYAAVSGDLNNLRALADYTIRRHYPECLASEQPYLAMFEAVLSRQAHLISRWLGVGFIHGVMNTDNMALSGETIDYGPCAFMDVYHPATVFSSIDRNGRYAYANQARIGQWNLSCLASALLPLLHPEEDKAVQMAEAILDKFPDIFQAAWLEGLRAKLGIFNQEPEDEKLAEDFFLLMQNEKMDFTNTFRDLSGDVLTTEPAPASREFIAWRKRWLERLGRQQQELNEAQALMRRTNPAFIPRNQKVEEALIAAAEHADFAPLTRLLEVLQNPFAYDRNLPEFSTPPAPDSCRYQTFCGT